MPLQSKEKLQTIGAGEFKAKCLALIDEVFETGKTIVITKRGEERVMMVPIQSTNKSEKRLESLMGSLRGMIEHEMSDEELMSPVYFGQDWERMAEEKWQRIERENAESRKAGK
jgi:prevent-host-death family protein